ncbi:hypothetical protein ACFVY0_39395 [Streptomyces sp. NPDC058286]|uniref:hypothetical protein n=1 Tax=Streptomyces sp. NPDC058286 TaxID=3346422 RepID=UPI0036E7D07A
MSERAWAPASRVEWGQELSNPSRHGALVALMDGISLQVLLPGGVYDAGYARETP